MNKLFKVSILLVFVVVLIFSITACNKTEGGNGSLPSNSFDKEQIVPGEDTELDMGEDTELDMSEDTELNVGDGNVSSGSNVIGNSNSNNINVNSSNNNNNSVNSNNNVNDENNNNNNQSPSASSKPTSTPSYVTVSKDPNWTNDYHNPPAKK